MRRRDLLAGALSLPVVLAAARAFGDPPPAAEATPFDAALLRARAKALAGKPWQAPRNSLSAELSKFGYDQYRTLRFDPKQALWADGDLPFNIQFFHRGFLYKDRVAMHEVIGGLARPVAYSPGMFDLGEIKRLAADDHGFAGFRIHAPINRPDYYDEVAAFLGASYFRAVAKNQTYGLSARGLAIATAARGGEEFPLFTAFWLERPDRQSADLVAHALLDSPSAAAAFRFVIRPGEATIFDVEMALYPREKIEEIGIAPLTSMFFFAPHDRTGIDDFRPAVHDSDGLSIWTGHGEQIWRPLANPAGLQISVFSDNSPRGFGLMQRSRDFSGYRDLEARYDRRPSLWIEPLGKWGAGAIHLIEIPTDREIHDNTVAFWRPAEPLERGSEHILSYRMHWCWESPWKSDLARIVETRVGAAAAENARLFVLEVAGEGQGPDGRERQAIVDAGPGRIRNVVVQPNPATGAWRISFELLPEGARAVELRAKLMDGDRPVSETWLYRWTP